MRKDLGLELDIWEFEHLRPIRRDLVVGAEREEVQGLRPGTLGRLEVDTLG